MNPVWDYVKKVEPHLPAGQRMQTAGALYTQLKAKKDALEKSLGRKASEAEIADMLRAEGDPADVGARLSKAPGEPDLVSRYLASVERRLPEANAKDIVAELREALAGRIEAREQETGRAATADDVAAVLKGFGHPVVVASKYAGHDYVIGPNYYPWFWHVQRIAVGAAIAIAFGLVALRALGADEPMRAVMRGIGGALEAGIWAFGVVTLLFIAAERTKLDMKWAEKWDPKSLPREHFRKPKSIFEAAISLFFDVAFILFWTRVLSFPNQLPLRDDSSVSLVLSPAWAVVYWPILALAVLAAAGHVHDLVRPAWTRVRSAMSIVGYAGGLAVLWVLFRAGPLVEVRPKPDTNPEELARAMQLVDGIATWSLAVTAVIWGVTIGVEVWRQVKATRPLGRGAAMA